MMKVQSNDSKQSFLKELTSMTKEDIEKMISSKGKPPKPIRPAFIGRK